MEPFVPKPVLTRVYFHAPCCAQTIAHRLTFLLTSDNAEHFILVVDDGRLLFTIVNRAGTLSSTCRFQAEELTVISSDRHGAPLNPSPYFNGPFSLLPVLRLLGRQRFSSWPVRLEINPLVSLKIIVGDYSSHEFESDIVLNNLHFSLGGFSPALTPPVIHPSAAPLLSFRLAYDDFLTIFNSPSPLHLQIHSFLTIPPPAERVPSIEPSDLFVSLVPHDSSFPSFRWKLHPSDEGFLGGGGMTRFVRHLPVQSILNFIPFPLFSRWSSSPPADLGDFVSVRFFRQSTAEDVYLLFDVFGRRPEDKKDRDYDQASLSVIFFRPGSKSLAP